MIRYIDLFAGVGGFRYGLEASSLQRGIGKTSHTRNGLSNTGSGKFRRWWNEQQTFNCVYSNEWDKYANSVYRKHYGECDDSDIRTIKASEIPDHDLLCGGFPCQSFSVAGKRGGFNDTRGTLFFDIARILKEKRPRYLLLENVKGLLSHDKGQTFQTILRVLSDLGYRVEWQVLNSKHYGVPQNRERVFIIGHLGGFGRRKVFPVGKGSCGVVQDSTNQKGQECAWAVRQRDYKDGTNFWAERTTKPAQWRRTEKGKAFRREAQKKGKDLTPFNDGYRELVPKDSSTIGTITSQAIAKDSLLFEDLRIRRLTPVECERLQGFPDNWTKYGHDGQKISDTQRYKMMGNAVTTNVITAIIRQSDWLEDAP